MDKLGEITTLLDMKAQTYENVTSRRIKSVILVQIQPSELPARVAWLCDAGINDRSQGFPLARPWQCGCSSSLPGTEPVSPLFQIVLFYDFVQQNVAEGVALWMLRPSFKRL